MATILRRSGQLSRLSRTSLLRSSQLTLRTTRPSILATASSQYHPVRGFASKPPQPPKKNDNGQTPSDNQQPANENKNDEGEPQKDEHFFAIPPGLVQMNPELTDALKQWTQSVYVVTPRRLRDRAPEIINVIAKGAIAEDLAGLLFRAKQGEMLSVLEVSRLMRLLAEGERRLDGKPASSDMLFLPGTDSAENYKQNFGSQGGFFQGSSQSQGQKQGEGQKDRKDQDQKNQQDGPSWAPQWFKINKDTSLTPYILGLFLATQLLTPSSNEREITWQELQTAFLDKGLVEKLTVINNDRVRVDLNREATKNLYPDSPAARPGFHYTFTIGSPESFERKLEDAQDDLGIPHSQRIPVSYTRETSWWSVAMNFGPALVITLGSFWLLKRMSGGAAGGGAGGVFGMGKSRAKMFNHERDIKVKFADVAGMDEAKVEIMEFVSFLKNPQQYERLGAKIPRGAILSGPPGTGKTLLAKATAGESGVPFLSVSGSEFVEMFVGVGPSRVRDLFAQARKNTPCIIFIDEIDAIGRARSKNNYGGGGNDERESTLNQILTEMDGFNTQEQVVVLAGTNRPDILDSALMRPGRFDRHISIDRPTMDGRKQIFAVHLKKIVTGEDLEYLKGRLAALTPGFSGADIANCVNEAALIAARQSATSVAMTHFEQAIERVIGGLEKKSLVLSPEDKKTVAYHEAGHAICGWYFKYADPLLKVSIIPRGQGALGYAQYLPSSDTYLMNTNQLMDRMAMTLGGRVSEELHFDTVTSGASDDFNKVTRMATAMVTKWGMSKKVGYLHFEDDPNRFQKPFAESTAQTIDTEVRRIIDEAYKQCKDLLTEKKKEVGLVAEELLKKEVLVRDDLVRILGKRPFGDPKDFEQYFGGDPVPPPAGGAEGKKSAPPPPPTESPNSPPEYPGSANI